MPLVMERGRTPAGWAEKLRSRPAASIDAKAAASQGLRVALINNMPDAAMEDTELQFFELLETAAEHVTVSVKLFCLPGVSRGERGVQRLADYYSGWEELLNHQLDGVIITGTEPHQPDLRLEPYWPALTEAFDWAERNTSSVVLSCLAAHAGVLYSDGIARHAMWYKMCGVFDCVRPCDHPLTAGAGEQWQFPHSRWNEVREGDLTACGYTVLTKSREAGVDCFVKRKRDSLFVHFQGHPEYGARTLFKEYRRDLRRFLAGERKNYPYVPHGYFDAEATQILTEFRERALAHPRQEMMADFPEAAVTAHLERTWSSTAIAVYRNWLQYILSRRTAEVRTSRVHYPDHHARHENLATS